MLTSSRRNAFLLTLVILMVISTLGINQPTQAAMVKGIPTVTSLNASPNPASPSQTVTLTADVTIPSEGCGTTSSDTVTFKDGTTTLGTVNVTPIGISGFASLSKTFSLGVHSLSAVYSGNGSCAGSTGNTTLTVISVGGTGSQGFRPECAQSYPVLGAVVIGKSNPQQIYDTPNGNVIKDSSGAPILLPNPNTATQNLYEYSVIATQTANSKVWYGLFIGSCDPVWMLASKVTVIGWNPQ